MDNFGEKFREYGFIPQNKGLVWYAIRNNILYSVCFEEHFRHNIYYFAQPLCSRLLRNFVNSDVKDSDISNHGYSALKDWQCQNQKLFYTVLYLG